MMASLSTIVLLTMIFRGHANRIIWGDFQRQIDGGLNTQNNYSFILTSFADDDKTKGFELKMTNVRLLEAERHHRAFYVDYEFTMFGTGSQSDNFYQLTDGRSILRGVQRFGTGTLNFKKGQNDVQLCEFRFQRKYVQMGINLTIQSGQVVNVDVFEINTPRNAHYGKNPEVKHNAYQRNTFIIQTEPPKISNFEQIQHQIYHSGPIARIHLVAEPNQGRDKMPLKLTMTDVKIEDAETGIFSVNSQNIEDQERGDPAKSMQWKLKVTAVEHELVGAFPRSYDLRFTITNAWGNKKMLYEWDVQFHYDGEFPPTNFSQYRYKALEVYMPDSSGEPILWSDSSNNRLTIE